LEGDGVDDVGELEGDGGAQGQATGLETTDNRKVGASCGCRFYILNNLEGVLSHGQV
jgi:hypothetical protein